MTFVEAIEQARMGHRMTREAWGEPTVYIFGSLVTFSVVLVGSRMVPIPYTPSIEDATATDWSIL